MEVDELRQHLMFLWHEYGNADESNMTEDAKRLAEDVRRLFRDITELYHSPRRNRPRADARPPA